MRFRWLCWCGGLKTARRICPSKNNYVSCEKNHPGKRYLFSGGLSARSGGRRAGGVVQPQRRRMPTGAAKRLQRLFRRGKCGFFGGIRGGPNGKFSLFFGTAPQSKRVRGDGSAIF